MSSSLDHASGHYALSSSSSSNNNNNNNSNNNNSNSNNPNDHNNSNSNGSHYGISGYPGQQPPPPQQQQQQQQRHNPHHHPQQQQQQQQQQQAQFYYPRQGNQPPPPQQQQQQQQRHPNTPYSQQQQQRLNSPPLPPLGSQYNTSQQDLSRQGHYNKHQQQPFDGYSHSGQPGQQQQVHYQDAQSGRAPPPPPLPSAPSQQHYSPPVGQGYVQESGEQGPASASSASVSGSSPPRSENGSNLRFRITLEAQTAAMQRQDETPVTYLNKGQFYTVGLEDTEEYDGEITSVIKGA
ncbi:hypothetical protein EDD21DRAFT_449419 [Dissophora ornata]|nr:hypothetical protein EDD21DRAFT_449419 [Dissophora ornata]